MQLVFPAMPSRRRPLAVGPLRCIAGRETPPPKHAWWKDLLSFDTGPPSEKREGSRAQTPVEPSIHLKWARQCRSLRASDESSEAPKYFGRPAALRPKKPPDKDGAKYAYPIGTRGRDWVQGLRDSDTIESIAANWQEAKQVRRRKERGLQKLHLDQVMWRQNQERKARSRLAFARSPGLKEEEYDEDVCDERYFSPLPQYDPSYTSAGLGIDGTVVEERRLSNIDGSPRSCGSNRVGFSRSNSSGSVSSDSSDRLSVGSQQYRSLEHADTEMTQDQLANNAFSLVRSSSRVGDRPQSQTAIDHPHLEQGTILEEQASEIGEEIPEKPSNGYHGTHQILSRRLSQEFAPKLRRCSLEPWEEWISEFPIETLDSLAEFFESHRMDSDGARYLGLAQLQSAMQTFLGFPAHLVVEQVMQNGLATPAQIHRNFGDASEQGALNISFASLPRFLSLIRDMAHRLERGHTNLVWSQDELKQLRNVFQRHSNSYERVQVAMLFDIIQELGMFSDINLNDKDDQQWLADVVRKVMSDRKSAESQSGTMSFDDFIRIVTSALRDQERAIRQSDFARERVARKETGFSALEMEDLRELHRTYQSVELPKDKAASAVQDPVSRMSLLLDGCTPAGLSEEDKRKLFHIIKNAAGFDRIASGGRAPFDIFLWWMKDVFTQGLGNLQSSSFGNSGPPTEEDLHGRKGFAAAMLRERAREIKKQRPQQMDVSGGNGLGSPPSEPHSRRNSHRESRPASRQQRRTLTDRPLQRQLTTEMAGRRQTNTRRHSGQPELKENRKRSTSAAHRHKYSKSTPCSQNTSRRSSFDPREFKRSTSRMSSVSSSSHSRGQNTVRSTGLPPSEAMLHNRAYRAPSIDMQGMDVAPPSQQTSPRGHMIRKQKTGVDSSLVIQDAISRLELKPDSPSPPAAMKGSLASTFHTTTAEEPVGTALPQK